MTAILTGLASKAALGLACLYLLAAAPLQSAGASALDEGLPTSVCSGEFCGPPQREIWGRFQNAMGLDKNRIPGVYSGTCYYSSPLVAPDAPQYAGIYISRTGGRVHFDGRFSFHKKHNPYDRLSVTAAAARFPQKHALTLFQGHAYADASDSYIPLRYWMRQDRNSDALLLVGYFGYRQTFLCALARHP